jgi:hypothetical protein
MSILSCAIPVLSWFCGSPQASQRQRLLSATGRSNHVQCGELSRIKPPIAIERVEMFPTTANGELRLERASVTILGLRVLGTA